MGANETRLVRWTKDRSDRWRCVDARSGGTLGEVSRSEDWWRGRWQASSAESPPMALRHAVAWIGQHLRRARCEVRGREPSEG